MIPLPFLELLAPLIINLMRECIRKEEWIRLMEGILHSTSPKITHMKNACNRTSIVHTTDPEYITWHQVNKPIASIKQNIPN